MVVIIGSLTVGIVASVTYADGNTGDETPQAGEERESGDPPGDVEPDGDGIGPVGETEGPVLDLDYDDSWVADFPQTIGGFNVDDIDTPKSRACTSKPAVSLRTVHSSLDDFLSDPPDVSALKKKIKSLPDAPSDFRLSFSDVSLSKHRPSPTGMRLGAGKGLRVAAWNLGPRAQPARESGHGCGSRTGTRESTLMTTRKAYL